MGPAGLDVPESASNPLVGFGELNDNIIKGLISLLSVEREIEFIAYTCELWSDKCIKLDDIAHNVQIKAKVVYCCVGRSWKQFSPRKRQQYANGFIEMASML
jgi:hypothetical protein